MDISTDCCTYWAQCIGAFSNDLWNIPYSHRPGSGRERNTDARQDRRIMRAAVAVRTASREEIHAHVAPAVLPTTIGNRLLAPGLRSLVPLAGYHLHHDTANHGYSGVFYLFTPALHPMGISQDIYLNISG